MIGSILKIEKRIHCKLSTFINQRPPCLGAFHWEKQNRTKVFEESISHSNDVKLQLEVGRERQNVFCNGLQFLAGARPALGGTKTSLEQDLALVSSSKAFPKVN